MLFNFPAKIIKCKRGDTIIECENGDITLRGRNINIEARWWWTRWCYQYKWK